MSATWILQQNHGLALPVYLQKHFSLCVQNREQFGQEINIAQIWSPHFRQQYGLQAESALKLHDYGFVAEGGRLQAKIIGVEGEENLHGKRAAASYALRG